MRQGGCETISQQIQAYLYTRLKLPGPGALSTEAAALARALGG